MREAPLNAKAMSIHILITGASRGIGAAIADALTSPDHRVVALSSAEGRAIRNVMTRERVAAFRHIFDEATAGLEEPRRTHAIAVLQFITSGFAWREMRDQWGLDAPAIAAASRWAVETLLTELRKGGGPKG